MHHIKMSFSQLKKIAAVTPAAITPGPTYATYLEQKRWWHQPWPQFIINTLLLDW